MCPAAAIMITETDLSIDEERCRECGSCADSCPMKALSRGEARDEGTV